MELNQLKIGENIAALRKSKGLTQEQLAAQLGISSPAVSKWETNASCPDIALLCPLARALGTNVDTLLQFEETLSDQEVVEQINAIIQTAMQQGCPAAEEKLQELLHRYPHCAALQFNAAAAYDTFQWSGCCLTTAPSAPTSTHKTSCSKQNARRLWFSRNTGRFCHVLKGSDRGLNGLCVWPFSFAVSAQSGALPPPLFGRAAGSAGAVCSAPAAVSRPAGTLSPRRGPAAAV